MATKKRAENNDVGKRPISITAVVDCVGALATGTLHGNLYFYDTNRAGGSTGAGTEELRTRVRAGDQLLWSVLALECEAYLAIDGIEIDHDLVEPERRVYPGTDVAYWIGTVKKDTDGDLGYRVRFKVGSRDEPITTTLSPSLVG
ncbi:hypothetical protein OKJ48_44355 [Streptomyces kunmingensis]|uniref:Allene oxide cyclase barrel-like domain-containing protein n=1 Tax=Streptomyces kunmingensis TaxID=68225 RepID=A0ABU6CSJ3_9ACTN|nr:hypothetical protein [Streptomyces kunmingensis]MEB3967221.1 hypothetical protein [Streptomyces kunmingensis]